MLEKAIEGLTEAMKDHTVALREAMATTTGAGAAPPASGKPAAASNRGRPPSAEAVIKAFKPYLQAEATPEGKERVIETVKPILQHFGVDKISAVEKEQRREAIGYGDTLMTAHKEGGIDAAEAVRFPFSEDQGSEPGVDTDSVL